MARYIITGGSGFVGQSLAKRIQANGDEAIIATRGRNHENNRHSWIEYDLREVSTIAKIVEAKPDGIFHLAWSTTPGSAESDPASDAHINLAGTIALLQEIARKMPVPVVFVSSGGTVYGPADILPIPESHSLRPIGIYGLTKMATEQYAANFRRRFNLDIRVARLSNPFGANQSVAKLQGAASIFARKILLKEPISIWGDGSVVRDYIDVDDASTGLISIMSSPQIEFTTLPVFNLGSGEGLSLNNLLEIIGEAAGTQPQVTYAASRSFDIPANVLDITLIRNKTDWAPRETARDAIRTMITRMQADGFGVR